MKTKVTTIMEVNFTSEELCEALRQYSVDRIKDKIGHIISRGVSPKFYIEVRENDNSATLTVSIID